MWKIIAVLIVCLTHSTLAKPSGILPAYESQVTYEPTVVGHSLLHVPTAVSHQSQTIVHEKRPYLRPIVEHRPVVQTYYPAAHLPLATYTTGVYAEPGWTPRNYVSDAVVAANGGVYYHAYQPWLK